MRRDGAAHPLRAREKSVVIRWNLRNRVSLNAVRFYGFYGGMLAYQPEMRGPLLDFQRRVADKPGLEWIFNLANRWVDSRMINDVERHFAHGPVTR